MRLYEVSKYAPAPLEKEAAGIIKYITTHCQPWLLKSYGQVVWRGVKHYKNAANGRAPNAFIRRTRIARTPKDSNENYHAMYNLWIQLVGGTANRSNSIFVTGNRYEARAYGQVFAVFPIGNFNYTWSPKLTDWYSNIEQIQMDGFNPSSLLTADAKEKAQHVPISIKYAQAFDLYKNPEAYDLDKLRRTIYVDQGLQTAIAIKHELLIKCARALYIGHTYYEEHIHTELFKYWKENIWKEE